MSKVIDWRGIRLAAEDDGYVLDLRERYDMSGRLPSPWDIYVEDSDRPEQDRCYNVVKRIRKGSIMEPITMPDGTEITFERTRPLSVHLSPRLIAALKQRAAECGLGASAYVRALLTGDLAGLPKSPVLRPRGRRVEWVD